MAEDMEASLCYCDYEPFDFFEYKDIKARKEHICCECGETIQCGDLYEKAHGIGDGQHWHYKTCRICVAIRRDYCAPYGGLQEILWDALGIDYVSGRCLGETDG